MFVIGGDDAQHLGKNASAAIPLNELLCCILYLCFLFHHLSQSVSYSHSYYFLILFSVNIASEEMLCCPYNSKSYKLVPEIVVVVINGNLDTIS